MSSPPVAPRITEIGEKDGEVVSMKSISNLMGVTPRTIKNWVLDGMPCEEQRIGVGWLFNSATCIKWKIESESSKIKELYDELFGDGQISFNEAKRRSAVATMGLDELKLQKELGEVAVIEDLVINFAAVLNRVKGKLSGMTSRLSGQLSHKDQEDVENILNIEVEEVLRELTDYEHTFIESGGKIKTSDYAKRKITKLINEAIQKNLSPPPKLTLVEWADKYRYLPKNSAEDGRWKTSRVHAARQPMLSVSDKTVTEITVMSCIQLLKTELMINTALYYMHQEPSPIMYVAPKKETAEAWSKERLVTSVNCTPVVANIFTENRRGQGTILQKQFAGGQISIVSANNPTDLAMRACRIMLFDEVDKYPKNVGAGDKGSGGEGDPIAVAWGRSTTYGKRAKK